MQWPVNRCLEDKDMDHIDHALGRPVQPLGKTHRSYFCTDLNSPEADEMAASACWHMGRKTDCGMVYFHVTKHGRAALAEHLERIGDKHRMFTVSWGGHDTKVTAKSHSQAKYLRWLDVNDLRPDLTFREFISTARARLSPISEKPTERTPND